MHKVNYISKINKLKKSPSIIKNAKTNLKIIDITKLVLFLINKLLKTAIALIIALVLELPNQIKASVKVT